MGEGVKTYFTAAPDSSFLTSGVRPRRSRKLVHICKICSHVSNGGAFPDAHWLVVTENPFIPDNPDDIAAASFSTSEQEPTFYWGLFRPLLYSALQGGIAYKWGLRITPGP